ncbi:MAG TPA: circularly permuted type 2 ATP-grasp protein [Polyangia bacterium]
MLADQQRSLLLEGYRPPEGTYDELVDASGRPREHGAIAASLLAGLSAEAFARCQALAELALSQQGVTFSVYSDQRGAEKVMPVCLVPRVIGADEWVDVERGLVQRLKALEMFLDDVYGAQRALKESVIPGELVHRSTQFLPKIHGLRPPGGVRLHIAGIDLIRDPDGTMRVLEDNLRTPSGVSYVLENRLVTKRVFQHAMEHIGVRRVDDYPLHLADTLRSVSPHDPEDSTIVVLTPGPLNSAYFEHSFLARSMGLELVEASDLFVHGDEVFVRTTKGPRRVSVIYRRTDDAYLDPEFFRPDSLLGVPGVMRAYAAGNVALANAPGNGVADDKAIYAFVPDLIRFYLSEEPLLKQVSTYVCAKREDRQYVLENLDKLVVKAVDEAGGYGMLMGPQSTAAERDDFRQRILADPRRYIAQPRIELSTCPTWIAERRCIEPRRVDLRPFVLTSRTGSWVLPGGLTRVALRAGSYVVNSSQGGGSKDTWVQAAQAEVA